MIEVSCENCPSGEETVHELEPGRYVVDQADGEPELVGAGVELTESTLLLTYSRDGVFYSVEYAVTKFGE
jgi:hypothetical protein